MVKAMLRMVSIAALSLIGWQSAMAADAPQVQRFDDWQTRCFAVKSPSPCDVFYGLFQKKSGLRVLMVSIAYAPTKNAHFMQVAVPLGVAVTKGITIKIGNFVSTPLEVRRCDRNGCFAELIAAPELIQALQANANVNGSIEFVADGGKPVSLVLSMKGFAKAYEAMVEAAKQHAGGG
jgi:invasion protein IalB